MFYMKLLENKEKLRNIAVIVVVILMCGIIFFYQTKIKIVWNSIFIKGFPKGFYPLVHDNFLEVG